MFAVSWLSNRTVNTVMYQHQSTVIFSALRGQAVTPIKRFVAPPPRAVPARGRVARMDGQF